MSTVALRNTPNSRIRRSNELLGNDVRYYYVALKLNGDIYIYNGRYLSLLQSTFNPILRSAFFFIIP